MTTTPPADDGHRSSAARFAQMRKARIRAKAHLLGIDLEAAARIVDREICNEVRDLHQAYQSPDWSDD